MSSSRATSRVFIPGRRKRFWILAVALASGACADGISPANPPDRLATVEWEQSGAVLYLQNAEGGGRVRVRFDSVTDAVPGNLPDLRVTDSTIRDMHHLKWSPDGRYLAVVVSVADDQSEVVLVSASGRAVRTVSYNMGWIWSDLEWSPDSRRLAWEVATVYQSLPDLFITDLSDDSITRVTRSGLMVGGVSRFDPTGRRLYIAEVLGWAPDSLNHRFRATWIDLATGEVVRSREFVGEPQGIARDGSWSLLIRWSGTYPSIPEAAELVRMPFLMGVAPAVLARGDPAALARAIVMDGDQEGVVFGGSGGHNSFRLVGLSAPNDVHRVLPTSPNTTWAALWSPQREIHATP